MSENEQTRNSQDLRGKVAIVTGAGARVDDIGNGRAASILLAEAGARVVLVDANRGWAERTCERARKTVGV